MALAGDRLPPGGLAVPFPSQTLVLWHRLLGRFPHPAARRAFRVRVEARGRNPGRVAQCRPHGVRHAVASTVSVPFFFNVNRKLINGFTIH